MGATEISSSTNYYSGYELYEQSQQKELEEARTKRTQTTQAVKALVGGEKAYENLPQITILSQYIQNRPKRESDLPIFYAHNMSFPVMRGVDPEKKREFLVIKRTVVESQRGWEREREEVLTIAQRAEDSKDDAWYKGQSKGNYSSYSRSPYQELGYTFLNQQGAQKVSEDIHDDDTKEYFSLKALLENKSLIVSDEYGNKVTYSIRFPEQAETKEFTLDQMPTEILTHIFSHVLKEINVLRGVCSLFRNIIDTTRSLQGPQLAALWKPHAVLPNLLGFDYPSIPKLGEFTNIPLNPDTYFPLMQGTDTTRKRTFYVMTLEDSYTYNNRTESHYEKRVFFQDGDHNFYYAHADMFGTGMEKGALILSKEIQEKLEKGISDAETKPYEDLEKLIKTKQVIVGDHTLTLQDTYTVE